MLDGSGDNYKIYKKNSNTSINLMYFDDGAVVLTNGMSIALEQATYRESTINGKVYGRPILISVDINGKNKNPNRWGWDLFTFELTKDKMTYNDGITKNFTPTFDYSNDNLTYTLEFSYNDEEF